MSPPYRSPAPMPAEKPVTVPMDWNTVVALSPILIALACLMGAGLAALFHGCEALPQPAAECLCEGVATRGAL